MSREFNTEELKGKMDSHLAESTCVEKRAFASMTLRRVSSRAPDSTVVSSPQKPQGGILSSHDESPNTRLSVEEKQGVNRERQGSVFALKA